MTDIIFSSWGGEIIENRGNETQNQASIKQLDLPEYFKQDQKIKAFMGWKGIVLRSAEVDIIDLCRAYFEAVLAHSKTCDKCNYCKTGWAEMLEVFEDIANGEATEEDEPPPLRVDDPLLKPLSAMQNAASANPARHRCFMHSNILPMIFHRPSTARNRSQREPIIQN